MTAALRADPICERIVADIDQLDDHALATDTLHLLHRLHAAESAGQGWLMQIRSIHLTNWRGHSEWSVDDLPAGITLISGPNEAGKSSIVEALHYGLFEQADGGGRVRQALVPVPDGGNPEVTLGLDVDGQQFEITKRFVRKTACHFRGPNERVTDTAEAEARLQALLGISVDKRNRITGEVDADLLRFWPALWLRQDRHGDIGSLLTDGVRESLSDVIGETVGNLTTGPMVQKLRERISDERSRYWTAGGRPTAELRQAEQTLQAAQEAQANARAAHAEVAQQIARLRELSKRREQREEHIESARQRLTSAQLAAVALGDLRSAQTDAEREHAAALATCAAAEKTAAQRQQVVDELAEQAPLRAAANRRSVRPKRVKRPLLKNWLGCGLNATKPKTRLPLLIARCSVRARHASGSAQRTSYGALIKSWRSLIAWRRSAPPTNANALR